MMKIISSFQNPVIKRIIHLQEKSRERKQENVFVIDGWKETKMAMDSGYEIETILYRKGFEFPADLLSSAEIIDVSEDVFDKISYRGNTSGVIAIAKQKELKLSSLALSKNPILLILDRIEKPGNLGAILRTADAAGIDGVVCCDIQTDMYNPNVVRSSVGCLFTVDIAISTKEECVEFLEENRISILTTSLKGAKNYLECDFKKPVAIVLGTESTGVDEFWENNSSANIIIPMLGKNDSLNVSNTAAIILFEALRQRQKPIA
ncbi:MAG: putative tRNA/rRNA methyltransferase [Bacteroidota bacterium]|nr:putative tRNA/rRNA methyltransferase [Bacteroidota bacterium]